MRADAAEDEVLIPGQFGCAPGTEGTERAEFTTEERSQRRTNGEDDVVRLSGWGVTPAAAGVRVARVATDASGPRYPPTCARRAPRHSTALRAVTPAGAESSPFRLRSLRSSVVNSVAFATSCSRPPQLLGSRSDHYPSAPMLARPATPEYTRTVRGWRVAPRPGTCAISACEPRQGRKAAALSRH